MKSISNEKFLALYHSIMKSSIPFRTGYISFISPNIFAVYYVLTFCVSPLKEAMASRELYRLAQKSK